ncbi:CoA-binding protein [Fodinibius salsisoli]|uniref:CoA-binding protein n=1 Tax=Fodinibius salsisoli TaxID=2820877 RepID=A0ABT3PNH2_9BACT|nr:CoA-binding protein [Fodinibius salsisoli]MCW9707403.1 CoA-binding protein [Fodinibius salsisoli]
MEVPNLSDIFSNARCIAIIGCSANKYRASYHIASYLKENGYRIIPVNPNYEEVLGEQCYPSVADIPDKYPVDIVDIFRDSRYTAEMVQQIIDWSSRTDQKPVIWTQLDVSSEEAETLAEEAGFPYIKNECMMVQHERLM